MAAEVSLPSSDDIRVLHDQANSLCVARLNNKTTFLAHVEVMWFGEAGDKFPFLVDPELNMKSRMPFSRMRDKFPSAIFQQLPVLSRTTSVTTGYLRFGYCELRGLNDTDLNVRKTVEYLYLHEWVGVVHISDGTKLYLMPTSSLTEGLGITNTNYPKILHGVFVKKDPQKALPPVTTLTAAAKGDKHPLQQSVLENQMTEANSAAAKRRRVTFASDPLNTPDNNDVMITKVEAIDDNPSPSVEAAPRTRRGGRGRSRGKGRAGGRGVSVSGPRSTGKSKHEGSEMELLDRDEGMSPVPPHSHQIMESPDADLMDIPTPKLPYVKLRHSESPLVSVSPLEDIQLKTDIFTRSQSDDESVASSISSVTSDSVKPRNKRGRGRTRGGRGRGRGKRVLSRGAKVHLAEVPENDGVERGGVQTRKRRCHMRGGRGRGGKVVSEERESESDNGSGGASKKQRMSNDSLSVSQKDVETARETNSLLYQLLDEQVTPIVGMSQFQEGQTKEEKATIATTTPVEKDEEEMESILQTKEEAEPLPSPIPSPPPSMAEPGETTIGGDQQEEADSIHQHLSDDVIDVEEEIVSVPLDMDDEIAVLLQMAPEQPKPLRKVSLAEYKERLKGRKRTNDSGSDSQTEPMLPSHSSSSAACTNTVTSAVVSSPSSSEEETPVSRRAILSSSHVTTPTAIRGSSHVTGPSPVSERSDPRVSLGARTTGKLSSSLASVAVSAPSLTSSQTPVSKPMSVRIVKLETGPKLSSAPVLGESDSATSPKSLASLASSQVVKELTILSEEPTTEVSKGVCLSPIRFPKETMATPSSQVTTVTTVSTIKAPIVVSPTTNVPKTTTSSSSAKISTIPVHQSTSIPFPPREPPPPLPLPPQYVLPPPPPPSHPPPPHGPHGPYFPRSFHPGPPPGPPPPFFNPQPPPPPPPMPPLGGFNSPGGYNPPGGYHPPRGYNSPSMYNSSQSSWGPYGYFPQQHSNFPPYMQHGVPDQTFPLPQSREEEVPPPPPMSPPDSPSSHSPSRSGTPTGEDSPIDGRRDIMQPRIMQFSTSDKKGGIVLESMEEVAAGKSVEVAVQVSCKTTSQVVQVGAGFKLRSMATQTHKSPVSSSIGTQANLGPKKYSVKVQTEMQNVKVVGTQTVKTGKNAGTQTPREKPVEKPRVAIDPPCQPAIEELQDMISLTGMEANEIDKIVERIREWLLHKMNHSLRRSESSSSDYEPTNMSCDDELAENEDEVFDLEPRGLSGIPSPVISGASNISEGELSDFSSPTDNKAMSEIYSPSHPLDPDDDYHPLEEQGGIYPPEQYNTYQREQDGAYHQDIYTQEHIHPRELVYPGEQGGIYPQDYPQERNGMYPQEQVYSREGVEETPTISQREFIVYSPGTLYQLDQPVGYHSQMVHQGPSELPEEDYVQEGTPGTPGTPLSYQRGFELQQQGLDEETQHLMSQGFELQHEHWYPTESMVSTVSQDEIAFGRTSVSPPPIPIRDAPVRGEPQLLPESDYQTPPPFASPHHLTTTFTSTYTHNPPVVSHLHVSSDSVFCETQPPESQPECSSPHLSNESTSSPTHHQEQQYSSWNIITEGDDEVCYIRSISLPPIKLGGKSSNASGGSTPLSTPDTPEKCLASTSSKLLATTPTKQKSRGSSPPRRACSSSPPSSRKFGTGPGKLVRKKPSLTAAELLAKVRAKKSQSRMPTSSESVSENSPTRDEPKRTEDQVRMPEMPSQVEVAKKGSIDMHQVMKNFHQHMQEVAARKVRDASWIKYQFPPIFPPLPPFPFPPVYNYTLPPMVPFSGGVRSEAPSTRERGKREDKSPQSPPQSKVSSPANGQQPEALSGNVPLSTTEEKGQTQKGTMHIESATDPSVSKTQGTTSPSRKDSAGDECLDEDSAMMPVDDSAPGLVGKSEPQKLEDDTLLEDDSKQAANLPETARNITESEIDLLLGESYPTPMVSLSAPAKSTDLATSSASTPFHSLPGTPAKSTDLTTSSANTPFHSLPGTPAVIPDHEKCPDEWFTPGQQQLGEELAPSRPKQPRRSMLVLESLGEEDMGHDRLIVTFEPTMEEDGPEPEYDLAMDLERVSSGSEQTDKPVGRGGQTVAKESDHSSSPIEGGGDLYTPSAIELISPTLFEQISPDSVESGEAHDGHESSTMQESGEAHAGQESSTMLEAVSISPASETTLIESENPQVGSSDTQEITTGQLLEGTSRWAQAEEGLCEEKENLCETHKLTETDQGVSAVGCRESISVPDEGICGESSSLEIESGVDERSTELVENILSDGVKQGSNERQEGGCGTEEGCDTPLGSDCSPEMLRGEEELSDSFLEMSGSPVTSSVSSPDLVIGEIIPSEPYPQIESITCGSMPQSRQEPGQSYQTPEEEEDEQEEEEGAADVDGSSEGSMWENMHLKLDESMESILGDVSYLDGAASPESPALLEYLSDTEGDQSEYHSASESLLMPEEKQTQDDPNEMEVGPPSPCEPPSQVGPPSLHESPSQVGPSSPCEPPSQEGPSSPREPPSQEGPSSPCEPPSEVGPPSPCEPPSQVGPPSPSESSSQVGPPSPREPPSQVGPSSPREPPSQVGPPSPSESSSQVGPPTPREPPSQVGPSSPCEPPSQEGPSSPREPPSQEGPSSPCEPPSEVGPPSPCEPPSVGPPSPCEPPSQVGPPTPCEPPSQEGPSSSCEPPSQVGPPIPCEPPSQVGPSSPRESPSQVGPPSPCEPPSQVGPPSPRESPSQVGPPSPCEPPSQVEERVEHGETNPTFMHQPSDCLEIGKAILDYEMDKEVRKLEGGSTTTQRTTFDPQPKQLLPLRQILTLRLRNNITPLTSHRVMPLPSPQLDEFLSLQMENEPATLSADGEAVANESLLHSAGCAGADSGHTELDVDSGHTELDVGIEDTELDADSGDMRLNTDIGDTELTTDIGDTELDVGIEDTELDADIGDTELDVGIEDTELNADIGDTELDVGIEDTELDADSGDMRLNTDIGDTELNTDIGDTELDVGIEDTELDADSGDMRLNTDIGDTELNTDIGDTELDVGIEDTELDADSGDMRLNTDIGDTELNTDIGDTELDVGIEDTELDADSGDMRLNTDIGDTELNTDIGDTELDVGIEDTELDADSGDMRLNTDIGDTELNTDIEDTELDVNSGHTELDVDSGDTELDVDSGDTELDVDCGDMRLDVDSGDAELDADCGDTELDVDCGDMRLDADSGDMGLGAADNGRDEIDAVPSEDAEDCQTFVTNELQLTSTPLTEGDSGPDLLFSETHECTDDDDGPCEQLDEMSNILQNTEAPSCDTRLDEMSDVLQNTEAPSCEPATDTEAPSCEPATDTEPPSCEPATDTRLDEMSDVLQNTEAPSCEPATDTEAPSCEPATDTEAPSCEPATDTEAPSCEPATDTRLDEMSDVLQNTEFPSCEPATDTAPPSCEPATDTEAPSCEPATDTEAPSCEPATDTRLDEMSDVLQNTEFPSCEPATDTAPPSCEPATDTEAPSCEPATDTAPPSCEPATDTAPPSCEPATDTVPPSCEPATDTAPPSCEPATDTEAPSCEPATDTAPPSCEPATDTANEPLFTQYVDLGLQCISKQSVVGGSGGHIVPEEDDIGGAVVLEEDDIGGAVVPEEDDIGGAVVPEEDDIGGAVVLEEDDIGGSVVPEETCVARSQREWADTSWEAMASLLLTPNLSDHTDPETALSNTDQEPVDQQPVAMSTDTGPSNTDPETVDQEPVAMSTDTALSNTDPEPVDQEPVAMSTDTALSNTDQETVDQEPVAMSTDTAPSNTDPEPVDQEPVAMSTDTAPSNTDPEPVDQEPVAMSTDTAPSNTDPEPLDQEPVAMSTDTGPSNTDQETVDQEPVATPSPSIGLSDTSSALVSISFAHLSALQAVRLASSDAVEEANCPTKLVTDSIVTFTTQPPPVNDIESTTDISGDHVDIKSTTDISGDHVNDIESTTDVAGDLVDIESTTDVSGDHVDIESTTDVSGDHINDIESTAVFSGDHVDLPSSKSDEEPLSPSILRHSSIHFTWCPQRQEIEKEEEEEEEEEASTDIPSEAETSDEAVPETGCSLGETVKEQFDEQEVWFDAVGEQMEEIQEPSHEVKEGRNEQILLFDGGCKDRECGPSMEEREEACGPAREEMEDKCEPAREEREEACGPAREEMEDKCEPAREEREEACGPAREEREDDCEPAREEMEHDCEPAREQREEACEPASHHISESVATHNETMILEDEHALGQTSTSIAKVPSPEATSSHGNISTKHDSPAVELENKDIEIVESDKDCSKPSTPTKVSLSEYRRRRRATLRSDTNSPLSSPEGNYFTPSQFIKCALPPKHHKEQVGERLSLSDSRVIVCDPRTRVSVSDPRTNSVSHTELVDDGIKLVDEPSTPSCDTSDDTSFYQTPKTQFEKESVELKVADARLFSSASEEVGIAVSPSTRMSLIQSLTKSLTESLTESLTKSLAKGQSSEGSTAVKTPVSMTQEAEEGEIIDDDEEEEVMESRGNTFEGRAPSLPPVALQQIFSPVSASSSPKSKPSLPPVALQQIFSPVSASSSPKSKPSLPPVALQQIFSPVSASSSPKSKPSLPPVALQQIFSPVSASSSPKSKPSLPPVALQQIFSPVSASSSPKSKPSLPPVALQQIFSPVSASSSPKSKPSLSPVALQQIFSPVSASSSPKSKPSLPPVALQQIFSPVSASSSPKSKPSNIEPMDQLVDMDIDNPSPPPTPPPPSTAPPLPPPLPPPPLPSTTPLPPPAAPPLPSTTPLPPPAAPPLPSTTPLPPPAAPPLPSTTPLPPPAAPPLPSTPPPLLQAEQVPPQIPVQPLMRPTTLPWIPPQSLQHNQSSIPSCQKRQNALSPPSLMPLMAVAPVSTIFQTGASSPMILSPTNPRGPQPLMEGPQPLMEGPQPLMEGPQPLMEGPHLTSPTALCCRPQCLKAALPHAPPAAMTHTPRPLSLLPDVSHSKVESPVPATDGPQLKLSPIEAAMINSISAELDTWLKGCTPDCTTTNPPSSVTTTSARCISSVNKSLSTAEEPSRKASTHPRPRSASEETFPRMRVEPELQKRRLIKEPDPPRMIPSHHRSLLPSLHHPGPPRLHRRPPWEPESRCHSPRSIDPPCHPSRSMDPPWVSLGPYAYGPPPLPPFHYRPPPPHHYGNVPPPPPSQRWSYGGPSSPYAHPSSQFGRYGPPPHFSERIRDRPYSYRSYEDY